MDQLLYAKNVARMNEHITEAERSTLDTFVEWYRDRHNDTPSEALQEVVEDPFSFRSFGKYKGQSLHTVMNNDPQYVLWLKDKCNILNTYQKMRVIEMFDGICVKCFQPHGHHEDWKTVCRKCYFLSLR